MLFVDSKAGRDMHDWCDLLVGIKNPFKRHQLLDWKNQVARQVAQARLLLP